MFSQRWMDYFMDLALRTAEQSKDADTKVGCVMVSPNKVPVMVGFNGPPAGVQDLPERVSRPGKYQWTAHAEQNAVAQAARNGVKLEGCTAFVTHFPCPRCTGSLLNAGVAAIVVGPGAYSAMETDAPYTRAMCAEAGVELTEYVGQGELLDDR